MFKKIFIIALLVSVLFSVTQTNAESDETSFLWEKYKKFKISPANPAKLKHESMIKIIDKLVSENPDMIKMEKLGESVEGRSINLITIGKGSKKLLLWSQMHGDEPTATGALLDIINYISKNPETPLVKDILNNTTLLIIPMLNPDGSERFTRRNAMDLDINRDARYLQTPEGQILKKAQERFQPDFGFNLHDHGPNRMVGKTKEVVSISLLVPAIDPESTQNDVTLKAKKVASTLCQSISKYCEGKVAKYDDDYMPRAFGDSMQEWGVSTILLETGGWEKQNRGFLTKVNFVGMLSVFHGIATGSYLDANTDVYDDLKLMGEHNLFDLLISKVTIINGMGHPPYLGDIGIDYSIDKRDSNWEIEEGRIADLGDLEVTTGKDVIDGKNYICTPGFILYSPELGVKGGLPNNMLIDLINSGVTTVVGQINLFNQNEVEQFVSISKNGSTGFFNIGIIGSIKDFPEKTTDADLEKFIYGISRNILGVCPKTNNKTLSKYLDWLDVKTFPEETLIPKAIPKQIKVEDVPIYTGDAAEKFGISGRGTIKRRMTADLLLFKKDADFEKQGIIKLENLDCMIFDGKVVFKEGKFVMIPLGKYLK